MSRNESDSNSGYESARNNESSYESANDFSPRPEFVKQFRNQTLSQFNKRNPSTTKSNVLATMEQHLYGYRNLYVLSSIYRIQKKYQAIMSMILANPPPKTTYKNEITIFVVAHGMDKKFVNRRTENIFENVRIFGIKNTNRLLPADYTLHTPSKTTKIYYNYKNVLLELLVNDAFSYPMEQREALIKSVFKLHYAYFPDDFLKHRGAKSEMKEFIDPDVGFFQPVIDHEWLLEYDFEGAPYQAGTFLVVDSTIESDLPHTCQGNRVLDLATDKENHLLQSKYWRDKLRFDENQGNILSLVELVTRLKKYGGYERINILDMSCRVNRDPFFHSRNVTSALKRLQRMGEYNEPVVPFNFKPTYNDSLSKSRKPYSKTIGTRKTGGAAQQGLATQQGLAVKKGLASQQALAMRPFTQENLLGLLMDDIRNDTPLKSTHMYQMYKRIVPRARINGDRKQLLYTWYLMIMLGFLSDDYERNEECLLILKGGKCIQFLVDGAYESEDIDVKVMNINSKKSLQTVSEQLSLQLTAGLEEVSVLKPSRFNPHLFKISYVADDMGRKRYIPIMDIDFKELSCEIDIECRLKRILSATEVHPVFMISLPFIQSQTLIYNTYPVSIQITEKKELIKEYDTILRDAIINDILDGRAGPLLNKIIELFNDFNASRGQISPEMNEKINQFLSREGQNKELERKIYHFIIGNGLDSVFYLKKFKRALEGLESNKNRFYQIHMKAAKDAVKIAHERTQRINQLKIVASSASNMAKAFDERRKRRQQISAISVQAAQVASKINEQRERFAKEQEELAKYYDVLPYNNLPQNRELTSDQVLSQQNTLLSQALTDSVEEFYDATNISNENRQRIERNVEAYVKRRNTESKTKKKKRRGKPAKQETKNEESKEDTNSNNNFKRLYKSARRRGYQGLE